MYFKLCRLWKKKTLSNPPPARKKHSTGMRGENDPNVHPSKCVTEYSREHLTVAAGKLFCKACSEILSVKRSTLENHIR